MKESAVNSMPLGEKMLYTPKQVCYLLSIGKTQLRELVEAGELTAHWKNGVGRKPLMIIAHSVIEYCERYTMQEDELGMGQKGELLHH